MCASAPDRHGFIRNRLANVTIMFALSMPVIMVVIGFAIDFGHAAQLRARLNAIADAAALAAVTPTMMEQSNANAITAATAMFNGQAASVTGLTAGGAAVTVTINNPNGNVLDRYVTVCYQATDPAMFATALSFASLQMSNCATANAEVPPNIDFYVLLDNSPSMALPATSAGLTAMQNLTSNQGYGQGSAMGCAFACHQASTNNGDTTGNSCNSGYTLTNLGPASNGAPQYFCTTTKKPTCSDGSTPTETKYNGTNYYYCDVGEQIDNYQLARNNSIELRLDVLNSGLTTLMQTAQTTTNSVSYATPPNYRFAVDEMDSSWQVGFTNLMALTSSYISGWSTASANFGVMEMYSNNYACSTSSCSSGTKTDDTGTDFNNALSNANSQMPAPGNGTNQAGDKPQEVLFWVTDGVDDSNSDGDDNSSGGTRLMQQINAGTSTNYCTTIKNRGIRIAILYTEYLQVPTNTWYENHIAPIQPDIGPALQACASTGLYYDVAVTGDLSQALQSLFQAVVQSANLSK